MVRGRELLGPNYLGRTTWTVVETWTVMVRETVMVRGQSWLERKPDFFAFKIAD